MSDLTRVYTSRRGITAHLTRHGTGTLCGLFYVRGFLGTGSQDEYERAADLPLCRHCKLKNGNRDVPNAVHQERYKLGTPVRFWAGAKTGPGRLGRTTTPVFSVGGTLCVTVEGYGGGIALTHVEPVTEAEALELAGTECIEIAEAYAAKLGIKPLAGAVSAPDYLKDPHHD